jgi:hypothetical protein
MFIKVELVMVERDEKDWQTYFKFIIEFIYEVVNHYFTIIFKFHTNLFRLKLNTKIIIKTFRNETQNQNQN